MPVVVIATSAPAFATSASDLSTSTGVITSPQKPVNAVLTIVNSGSGPTTSLKVSVTTPTTPSSTQSAPAGWTVTSVAGTTVVFTATTQLLAGGTRAVSFVVDRGNNGSGTVTVVIDPGGGGQTRTISQTI